MQHGRWRQVGAARLAAHPAPICTLPALHASHLQLALLVRHVGPEAAAMVLRLAAVGQAGLRALCCTGRQARTHRVAPTHGWCSCSWPQLLVRRGWLAPRANKWPNEHGLQPAGAQAALPERGGGAPGAVAAAPRLRSAVSLRCPSPFETSRCACGARKAQSRGDWSCGSVWQSRKSQ